MLDCKSFLVMKDHQERHSPDSDCSQSHFTSANWLLQSWSIWMRLKTFLPNWLMWNWIDPNHSPSWFTYFTMSKCVLPQQVKSANARNPSKRFSHKCAALTVHVEWARIKDEETSWKKNMYMELMVPWVFSVKLFPVWMQLVVSKSIGFWTDQLLLSAYLHCLFIQTTACLKYTSSKTPVVFENTEVVVQECV